jgi:hypothetical protein
MRTIEKINLLKIWFKELLTVKWKEEGELVDDREYFCLIILQTLWLVENLVYTSHTFLILLPTILFSLFLTTLSLKILKLVSDNFAKLLRKGVLFAILFFLDRM